MKYLKHTRLRFVFCFFLAMIPYIGMAQQKTNFTYHVETSALVSGEGFSPFWLTSNKYGVYSNEDDQALLRAGLFYEQDFKHHWKIEAGLDLVTGFNLVSKAWVHQAYADFSWRKLTLSVGSKERMGSPLDKNKDLTGGWMVEGINMRPFPQVRVEFKDYVGIPGTNRWLSAKGHLAYGWMLDGNWQTDFSGPSQYFMKDVLYHSKSLMLRVGKKESFPLEFEFGLITAAQFGGKKLWKQEDGTIELVSTKPHGFKEYMEILIPKQKSTLENVHGNHCGSWNFALDTYIHGWKVRTYLEHYFEDHSQMFWEYGRWKDGLVGFEIIPVKNRWISSVVWEGMSTKDQTKSVLYDGVGGSFGDLQMSGNDHYYNNYEFLGWQYYGASLGHPFLYGPQYNADGSNEFKSTRVRSNHLGIAGMPSHEWSWRMLTTFIRHWGSYRKPLDKQRKQFSGLAECTFQPAKLRGWGFSMSVGFDRGNYLGNQVGGMFTIRKIGGFDL